MSGTPYYRVDPEHSGEQGREVRIFGPPGTGKTTFLSGSVRNTALLRGSDNVVVASFTVTAAAELQGRGLPLPKSQIGTLHSLAYRQLDRPPVADEQIDDWNTHHPALTLSVNGRKVNVDDGAPLEAGAGGATDGDALAARLDSLRARMVPRDDWPADVRDFADKWEDWKGANGLIDFTDMIEHALTDVPTAPGKPDVGFFDEVQDFTPLELALIRKWGQHMERMVLAGDDDQCSVAGTMVLTTNRGEVPIEELTDGDLLVSYDRFNGGKVRGRGADAVGYLWQRAVRPYTGRVHRLTTNRAATEVTHDHRTLVRWAPRAEDAQAVYLMRKGDWWRIGMVKLIYPSGDLGPAMRLRQEDGDASWLLGVYDTREAACVAEHELAARYGVTTALWRRVETPHGRQPVVSAEALKGMHTRLADDSTERAHRLLRDLHLDPAHPLIERPMNPRQHMGAGKAFVVRAANIASGWMQIPTYDGTADPDWQTVTTTSRAAHEDVYSLNVDPYHHYVADQIVLPNCIYGFKGASPDAFLNPEIPDGDKIVLSQSWRIPASVHRAAEHWIGQVTRREPKLYAPRAEEGVVRQIAEHYQQPLQLVDQIERSLATTAYDTNPYDGTVTERPSTVMLLASCAYMLDPVKHELRARGIPFHNPYRKTRGDWNPLTPSSNGVSSRERLLAYLVLDEREFGEGARPWTGSDVKRWAHVVKKQGIFVRGAVAAIEALPDRELDFETELAPLFANEVDLEQAVTPDLDWFARNLLAASRNGMAFPLQVARKRGAVALVDVPRVVIGTIHSVKGGQADVVYLVPDLSSRGSNEWRQRGLPQDGVRRQMYVGMTRARRELAVCNPATKLFVEPEKMIAGARRNAS